ncbi:DUF1129 family protein [Priestia filamentosa]|uniref:Uncharacterized protein n=1 Tax=Priestia filamentosa TaxID=1402861 RepID=A0A1X7FTJ1_9BACI|nr:DUF1129 family protein [Priestia filamentosa]AWG44242.1 hypothetical protein BEH_24490 [Priestia filamentosa]MDT3765131.1 DUF1129 family protein [Priestia filamentosa]OXS66835.1 hypothetical protein B1B01_19250 [Priestia filamentosa]WCM15715.1 DUF1129 family protein [Priestia filamentosa]WRU95429.1 DUF1129 family protein [Priestia filamentosa]
MTTEELIKRNAILQRSLTKENAAAYEIVLTYVRGSNVSERATEETLLEIIEHLIAGQKHGKNAEDLFGRDLKRYSKDIVANLPKETKLVHLINAFYFGTLMLMWMFIVETAGQFLSTFFDRFSKDTFSIIPYLISLISLALLITCFMKLLKNADSKLWTVITIIVGALNIPSFIFSRYLFEDVWILPINFSISFFITLSLFLIQYTFKKWSKSLRNGWV